MSDLQLSLLAASGVVIVGVLAYNKWQERKHRKVAQAVFAEEKPDVLMGQEELLPDAHESGREVHEEPALAPLRDVPQDERREPSLSLPDEVSIPARVEPTMVELSIEPDTLVRQPLSEVSVVVPLPVTESLEVEEQEVPEEVGQEIAQVSPDISSAFFMPSVPRSLAHPECDAVVTLELISGVSAAALLTASQDFVKRISKPVFWIGVNAEEQWQLLDAETGGVFKHLRLIVQLADRQGPISEPEISLVRQAVQALAAESNAVVDVSDLDNAIARAQQLDQFCVEVDLQIGINLVGPIPFLGTKIRALAEAAGMSVNSNGAFEKQNDDGLVLFTLSNQEATPFAVETLRTLKTHGLTFVLDVPRVSDTGFVYDHMLRLARQFSEALQAKIVDDNRRPLSDAQLSNIREQFVVKPQQDMAAKRIPPGSTLALRLFS